MAVAALLEGDLASIDSNSGNEVINLFVNEVSSYMTDVITKTLGVAANNNAQFSGQCNKEFSALMD